MHDIPGANPENRAIEASLDALARVDSVAPPGFEQRIADTSLPAFHAAVPVPSMPTWRVKVVRTVLATAAVIAIAGLAAVWSGGRSPTMGPTAPSQQDAASTPLDIVDSWLGDSPLAENEAQIDDLFFAIVEFNPRSAPDWTVDDLLTLEGDAL